ncbi:MAG: S-adenosylmethionine-dependent methyltransferase [Trichoglossum hirsutum]|nr:MAG: S-adenosylmethionine-dependent methyltransferase [Trichoglossum hirsutum]
MLPTPSTSHLTFHNIYEPAEDTFLLLDTLSSAPESRFLHSRFSTTPSAPPPLALEIGSGSGVVVAFLTAHARAILGRADLLTAATDVNAFACAATRSTVEGARGDGDGGGGGGGGGEGVFLDAVLADLDAPLRPGEVDLLVFNPPYVPTPDVPPLPHLLTRPPADAFDRDSHLLSLAYAGGPDGMATTDRLLRRLPDLLSCRDGVAYLLLCAQNCPSGVAARVKAWGPGWDVETVARSGMAAGWEKLQVLRIWRTGHAGSA